MRSFLGVFVGRKVFDARLAAEPTPGRRRGVSCDATGVSVKTSVTAGTIFEGTRKPLRLWFQAMWYVTNQKHGVSALGLQRILGLGSYQTAWAWLHKLRRAMVRPGRDLLGGAVEVDETYVGGRETGVVGRQTKTKSIVAIAGGSPRAGHWPDPNEPRRGCGCEEPDPVCPNNRGAWRDRPNRWLVSLQWSGEPRL